MAKSNAIDTAFSNVSDTGGTELWPTGVETMQVRSTDANDTAAGTGAQSIIYNSLDANHEEVTTVVALNGTTPVAIPGTHLRHQSALVTPGAVGSGRTNLGDIIIETTGALERLRIPAAAGVTSSGIYTIPAGKTGYGKRVTVFPGKNQDIIFRSSARINDMDPILNTAEQLVYQQAFSQEIHASIPFLEKTDFRWEARTVDGGPGSEVTIHLDLLLIDN